MDLKALFGGAYSGRRVLVTGHTGFKGSWLTTWLQSMGAKVVGIALDPDTDPSHWNLLAPSDVVDLRIDLRDADGIRDALSTHRPEVIFHLAAQPLVRRSYREPVGTFDVNVMGLVNLLEAVRGCASVRVFVNATTDKVYEHRADNPQYMETDPLGGHDPYSTSKACAELVSACYRKSFFSVSGNQKTPVRLATARAGNVIGGGDWADDRLVPDLIRAGISGQSLQVRNPRAIRPWQHVLEPLSGYLLLGGTLLDEDTHVGPWNFGPGKAGELSVESVIEQFSQAWPKLTVDRARGDQPHETDILRLSCEKAMQELGWRPVWETGTAIERTAMWYRAFYDAKKLLTTTDIQAYVADAARKGLAWAA